MKRMTLATVLVVLAGANSANAQLFGRFNSLLNNDATIFATESDVSLENASDAAGAAQSQATETEDLQQPYPSYHSGGMGIVGGDYFNPGESQGGRWISRGGYGHGNCGDGDCGYGGHDGAGLWSGYCSDRHRAHHGRGGCGRLKMPHLNLHGCGRTGDCHDCCGSHWQLPKIKMPKFNLLHGCGCGGCSSACGRGCMGCGWNLFAGFNLRGFGNSDACDECGDGIEGEVWSDAESIPEGEEVLPPAPPTPPTPTYDTEASAAPNNSARWLFPPRLSLFPVGAGQ